MKRLIYITDQPWSTSGAPTIHVDRVCTGLCSQGWSVDVVHLKPEVAVTQKPYTSIPINVPRFCRAITFQFAIVPVLMLAALRNQPRVLYVRQGTLLALPVLASSLLRIPFILEVNGHLLMEATQRGNKLDRLLLKLNVLQLIESINIRNAKHIVAVAPGIGKYLATRYPEAGPKISVVPNGVDRVIDSADYSTSSDGFCVGYVGALESWQGLEYLIRAAGLIKKRVPKVDFLIVGDGMEKEKLLALAQSLGLDNEVNFVGSVPHARIMHYLRRMNLCINYPVRARGGLASPMKVYEYLASRRPVLSADVTGLRAEFGTSIEYVNPEDSSALADKIEHLYTDRTALESLQSAARIASQSIRSWSDVARDIALLCDQV